MDSLEEPWGLLVAKEGGEDERIPVIGHEFVIGRAKDCGLCITNSKLVSNSHCVLVRDDRGRVILKDTSSNGTLINGKRIKRNEMQQLKNGDIVHIVCKKNRAEDNISYQYTELRPAEDDSEKDEEEATLELTLDYGDNDDGDTHPPPSKKPATEVVKKEEERLFVRGFACQVPEWCMSIPVGGISYVSQGFAFAFVVLDNTVRYSSSKDSTDCADIKLEAAKPHLEKKASKEKSDKVKTVKEKSMVKKETSKVKESTSSMSRENSMEEILMCGICQEILHDCISLQPCMHSYCAGCYSGWMDRSNECPQCRLRVKRISKNHMVNNLALAFLKAHPEKKRSDEDLAELDSKNRITKDMLYPKRRHRYDPDEDDYDEDEDEDMYSDEDEEDDSSSGGPFSITSPLSGIVTTGASVFGSPFRPPPMAVCRQCPTYRGGLSSLCSGASVAYTCPTPASHVMCRCCLQFMPLRPPSDDVPPQKCVLCEKYYCNAYWQSGCSGMACRGGGCLLPLKDVSIDAVPRINDNLFETNILRSYLQDNSVPVSDLVTELITKFESGEYHPPTTSGLSSFTSSSPVCKECYTKILSELTYIYRSKIATEDLPVEAHHRGDCHWGRNCRTQKHNPDHCRRFNHICDQTRF